MASKKFRGKLCVYCAQHEAETSDHVFARQFFLGRQRAGLPQVPACLKCNGKKSVLEHYLGAVLGFGGWHADSKENLSTQVPKRLAKNRPLHLKLARGMEKKDGTMTVPLEPERLLRLCEYIARGLAYHHWRTLLRPPNGAEAMILVAEARVKFDELMNVAGQRVSVDLGNGTFSYIGLQDAAHSEQTVWQISIYGGLQFSDGDNAGPTRVDVLTGSSKILDLIPT